MSMKKFRDSSFMDEIIRENREMLNKVNAELNKCKSFVEADQKSEELRRISVRALFSGIEVLCYRLKISALVIASDKGIKLKNKEIAMLNEESYYLEDNGLAKAKKVYSKITSNLRFVFRIFARVVESNFKLDVGGEDWKKFKRAVEVRNNITHPKGLQDMVISEDDFKKVTDSYDWFVKNLNRLVG